MNVIGVILGGGAGTRLQPLTTLRSKPAVPLAGKYRLVDVPISNCINSHIFKIYMLTQYNSGSLHYHVQSAYQFDSFSRGFVRLLAAEQTPSSKEWFQGTADAVRQSMHHLGGTGPDLVVILSGDQLYRMDFKKIVEHHVKNNSDVTISLTPVERREAGRFGIVKIDENARVINYKEKPDEYQLADENLSFNGKDSYLASMGIYVFDFSTLRSILDENDGADFGKDILPDAFEHHNVYGYVFEGYWKDIGTIGSFWEENIALTGPNPPFTFYDNATPIYTRARFLPPSRIHDSRVEDCLITEGLTISAAYMKRSVVGLRSVIKKNSIVANSVIMGSDFFENKEETGINVPLGIGENCRIDCAIVDKNVRIGSNVSLSPHGLKDISAETYSVKDGVLVIPKGAVFMDNTTVGEWRF